MVHALKNFPLARSVLENGGLTNKLLDENDAQCIDWIEDAAQLLDNKAISDLITVLWNVWNSRNNRVF